MVYMMLFILFTSAWVAYDSGVNQISISKRQPYSLNTGAVAWFLSCLLLWIPTFPYYLFRRAKVLGEKKMRG